VPRQIIDTETGRPAYIRRRVVQAIVLAVVVIAIVAGVLLLLRQPVSGRAASVPLSRSIQETSPTGAESGAFPHRRSHAA